MMTDPNSQSANAFRTAAKNLAAQCSIVAAKLQEEMAAEASNTEAQSPETTANASPPSN